MFYLLTEKVPDGTAYAYETLFPSIKAAAEYIFDVPHGLPHQVIAVDVVAGTCVNVTAEAAAAVGDLSFEKGCEPHSTVHRWCWDNGVDCWSDDDVYAAGRRVYREREASRIGHRNAVL